MDENRLTFRKKFLAMLLCSLVFSVVYNGATFYASNLENVPSFTFDFEKYIPFIGWTIIPYMTSGLFFITVFFFCKSLEELKILTKRILFIIIFAGICFVLFPLKYSFPKPIVDQYFLKIPFQFLKTFDSPFNQAPSLHIAFTIVFWSVFKNIEKWKYFILIWLLAIALSTLTTFQHHLIDVFTGVLLAYLSFILFPFRKNDILFRNDIVAHYYYFIGILVLFIAFLFQKYFGQFWLLLIWPSFVILTIGFHYQKNNVYFLKNKKGEISVLNFIFYAPYILLYKLSWIFYRKNRLPVEIAPQLFLSSRLSNNDLQKFNHTPTYIFDLSAEMEENEILINKTNYTFHPILDIGTFNEMQTEYLIATICSIYSKLNPTEKILIHCTMGVSRSSAIGILVIKNILSLPLDEIITQMKFKNKECKIHPYLKDFLNK